MNMNLNPAVLVALLTVLFTLRPALATDCQDILAGKSGARDEIVGLVLEKDSVNGPSAASMRLVLQTDIDRKLQEYTVLYGETIDPEALQRLVQEKRREFSSEQNVRGQKVQQLRDSETEHLIPFVERFTTKIKSLSLDPRPFNLWTQLSGHQEMSGDGIQWSKDERFVLARGILSQDAKIIDTQTWSIINSNAVNGMLSLDGHYLLANTQPNKTWVHNLDTGERVGPYNGLPVPEFGSANHHLLRDELDVRNKRYMFSVIPLTATGAPGPLILLGENYAATVGLTRVAKRDGNQVVVIDVATAKELVRINTDHDSLQLLEHEGFCTYIRDGKHLLLDLSTLTQHEIPESAPYKMVYFAKGQKVIYSLGKKGWRNVRSYGVYDLSTRTDIVIDEVQDLYLSPDRSAVLFGLKTGPDSRSVYFDLLNGKREDLDLRFSAFSPDSEWLIYNPGNGKEDDQIVVRRRRTGEEYEFKAHRSFHLVPGTNLALVSSSVLVGRPTFISDLTAINENPYQIPLGGTEEAVSSPSGRFIVTVSPEDENTLKILELRH